MIEIDKYKSVSKPLQIYHNKRQTTEVACLSG